MPDVRRALHVVGIVVLVAAAGVTAVVAAPQVVGADESYVVVSGSMRPTLQAGDVVVVSSTAPANVDSGDVVAFDRIAGDGKRTTHRVVEVIERDGQRYFRTKGDANEEADRRLVPEDALIGRMAFSIPYVGWAFSFASTDTGTLAFVAVPGVLLVVSELWSLVAAARGGGSESDGSAEHTGESGR
ncbi:signal peptidase I [Halobacterium litoreum]|uniref:Signal peptidase I n=1 Tax=Halobacterium litoreum TaxID=2039234 RepID=A0ABD5NDF7_9EURY|nr:signal peptidase I [Halobacterium litoreum]UHH14246.1 signal peptidase I [Halobacterium litoreum]